MAKLDLQQKLDKKELARQLRNSIDDLNSYVAIEPTPKDAVDYLWKIEVQKLALKHLEEECERDALQHQVNVLEVLKGQKDERIAQLEEQVNALAAENLSLLDFDWVSFNEDGPYEPGEVEALLPNTRATDAIKRQWMAEGVDEFGKYHNFSEKLFIQKEAVKFAAQLRQPEEKGHE